LDWVCQIESTCSCKSPKSSWVASHQKTAGEQWKGKEKLTPRTDSIDGHFFKSLQIERQNAELITTPKTILKLQQNPSQTEVNLSNQILSSEKVSEVVMNIFCGFSLVRNLV
jgi:hypothetical protein